MHPRTKFIPGLVILFLLVAPRGEGQTTSYSSEPHILGDARVVALGDAGVAYAYNAAAMYWNPASITFLRGSSAVATNIIEVVGSDHLATVQACGAILLGEGWAIGLGGFYHWAADAGQTISESDRTYKLSGVELTIARKFGRFLSLGAQGRFRRGTTWTDEKLGALGTVGLYYAPVEHITYGMAYEAVGSNIRHPVDTPGDNPSLETYHSSGGLSLGVSFVFPVSRKPKVISATFAGQGLFKTGTQAYKGGIEWTPLDFLALRAGYWTKRSSQAAKFGLAFKSETAELGVAASFNKREPQHVTTTLSYTF